MLPDSRLEECLTILIAKGGETKGNSEKRGLESNEASLHPATNRDITALETTTDIFFFMDLNFSRVLLHLYQILVRIIELYTLYHFRSIAQYISTIMLLSTMCPF